MYLNGGLYTYFKCFIVLIFLIGNIFMVSGEKELC